VAEVKKYTISRFDWERTIRRIVMPTSLKSTKLVALMLATYADADGSSIYPSVERLADVCQLGRSTVSNSLKWLRDDALLIHRHQHGTNKGGRKLADVYQLCRPSDWEDRFTLLAENGKDMELAIPRPRRANPNPLGTRRFDVDSDKQATRQTLDSR
jgi:hypothetical protein